jgi:hypothetical protein
MKTIEKCEFYREPSSLHVGVGIGYCDIDCINAICDGDILFCERKDNVREALSRARQGTHDAAGGVKTDIGRDP